jgi:hypothetical protein
VLLSSTPFVWVSAVALVPAGAPWVLVLSMFNVAVHLSTPRWVLGRALSIYQTATFGGMAVGAWLWGMVAERVDLTVSLWAAGGVLAGGAALGS